MGIISFVKGGVRELAIARPDEFKNDIVYKHPDPTIPNKAQLTVEADELVLFFRDGKFVGAFAPGRHTLDSSSIPFLGQLVDKFTGGNVYIAEAYFVTTREIASIKYGGKVGKLRDPQSGLPVELMVNGTFSMRVIDAPRLVIGLVGLQRTGNEAFLDWFRDLLKKTLRDDIAELCVKKKWPLLDVTSGAYSEEIETEALSGVRGQVEPYGIEVTRLGDLNIAMNPKDEERLNKFFETASYVGMGGGIQGYQQIAQGQMLMQAGDAMKMPGGGGGGGGNPLMQGAGLAVGLGMAGQMMNLGHNAPQGAPAPQPNIPPTGMQGSAQNVVACAKCGARVAPGKFCAECGAVLAAPGPKFCSSCGKPMTGKFCGECGTAAP